jgi:hypothetical protein
MLPYFGVPLGAIRLAETTFLQNFVENSHSLAFTLFKIASNLAR